MRFDVVSVSLLVVGMTSFFGVSPASAEGLSQSQTSDQAVFTDTPAAVCVTQDVAVPPAPVHVATLAEIIRARPAQRAFVWQLRDPALAKDPLTIQYQPPVELTLSFDLEHHRVLPVTLLPKALEPADTFTAQAPTPAPGTGTPGSISAGAIASSGRMLTTLANFR